MSPLFFAPFVSSIMRVEPEWIDYNGHLNMAYYNVLFDRAVDEVYELIGCGLAYLKETRHSCFTAEVHVRYLRELHAGDAVPVTFQLIHSHSHRLHYFEDLRHPAPALHLAGLNPEPRPAGETLGGPVLVLAGAGTGKTRVLTVRIAHILAAGRAWPSEILAVTFTNKAAREMKHRVGEIVGGVVEGMPWLGTFHSIGVKILRRHAALVGLHPDFTILHLYDQIPLIKQLLQ